MKGLLWMRKDAMNEQIHDLLARMHERFGRGHIGVWKKHLVAWDGEQVDQRYAQDIGNEHLWVNVRTDDPICLRPANEADDLPRPLRLSWFELRCIEVFPAFGCLPGQDAHQPGMLQKLVKRQPDGFLDESLDLLSVEWDRLVDTGRGHNLSQPLNRVVFEAAEYGLVKLLFALKIVMADQALVISRDSGNFINPCARKPIASELILCRSQDGFARGISIVLALLLLLSHP